MEDEKNGEWLPSFLKTLHTYSAPFHPNNLIKLPTRNRIPVIQELYYIDPQPNTFEVPKKLNMWKIALDNKFRPQSEAKRAETERQRLLSAKAINACLAYRRVLALSTIYFLAEAVGKEVTQVKERIAKNPLLPPHYKESIDMFVELAAEKIKSQIKAIPESVIDCELTAEDTASIESAYRAIERNALVYYNECVKHGDNFWIEIKEVCEELSIRENQT